MNADDALYDVAARQHGFVTRLQARTAGLSRDALLHRIRRGEWVTHGRRVLHRSGTPWTRANPLMRAVLDAGPGAVISHATAAAWWGLPGFDLLTVHITRPRGTTSAPATFAGHVHEVLDLGTDQVTVLDGVPIVRPERLVFELCATAHPLRAERALDTGWAKALYSGDSLRRIHRELACRGRGGTVLLRERGRRSGEGRNRSPEPLRAPPGESEVVATGLRRRPFKRGFGVHGAEPRGKRYHSALSDQVQDERRRKGLETGGFVVVEVWDTQVWHARHDVVAEIRAGIARARAHSPAA